MNPFHISKEQASFYTGYSHGPTYTISAKPIEEDSPAALAEALLDEFCHSTEDEKEQFRTVLEKWLIHSDEKDMITTEAELLQQAPEAVINNIYEMF